METKQKISQVIANSAADRLRISLELIGVTDADPKHHRHNLISSIMLYSVGKGDSALEEECKKILESIKAE